MTQVLKIALEGYDASTDTNPDHFSLYVDQQVDYILIKEKVSGTVNGTSIIAHNLGYVPFCLVFQEISSGVWRKTFSAPLDGVGGYFTIDATNLKVYGSGNFAYHIFYDNIT
jgi:hypothetical protein